MIILSSYFRFYNTASSNKSSKTKKLAGLNIDNKFTEILLLNFQISLNR